MDGKSSNWRPGPSVCRCCLSDGCYKDIATEYFWMGKREVYEEMLVDTLGLTISFGDSNAQHSQSRLICETCISRLRNATDFKKQVKECEQTFLQYLNPSTLDVVEDVISLEKEEKQVTVKEEKSPDHGDDFNDNNDFLDDDNDDELDDQPLMNLATKVPKKESVDVFDLLDNAKPLVKRKSTTKAKTTSSKKAKIKETKTKPKEKPEKKKKGPVETEHKRSMWTPKRKFNDHRDNAAIIIECSNACPFRWMRGAYKCGYCTKSFTDFKAIYEHTVEHPNRVETLKFARAFDNIKIEITDLECILCNHKTCDLDTLKDHLVTVHNKPIIKNLGLGVTPFLLRSKEFVCAHCEERFILFTKLNNHMNEHYPNNICSHCGKAFSAAHRLKAHQIIHEPNNAEYKCTKCDKVFESKSQRNSHIYLAHKSEFRYKCPYCNEAFKSYSKRLKHLNSLHGQKVEYPCHLCPSVFLMYNQRTKHIRHVHIQHRPFLCEQCPSKFSTGEQLRNHMVKHSGERKYQCEVCKKKYPRIKTLREHMRIHKNDRRFACQYCSSAFIQKCSLKSHLRTHHPNVDITQ
ncbi:zinc finger protein 184-like isoform X8 [Leptidea sinapis]|uniref:zinc finger protein 184-like isoform X8 n=1 Tax=Leptidea sinapis TaxID=189913 RepID=UPI0021C3C884|nr:zinc finger protein 184-like isoform X8 [Leptidea sinapis]